MAHSPTSFADRRPLQSARLDLEPVRVAHARETWPLLNDPRLWRFFPELRPRSLEHLREIYVRRERGYTGADGAQIWGNWILRLRSSGEPVGDVQATIFPVQRRALVAYATYPAFQRHGFAREAVAALIEHLIETYCVKRIVAEMDVRNAPSYLLVESLGFTRATECEGEYAYELLNDRSDVGPE